MCTDNYGNLKLSCFPEIFNNLINNVYIFAGAVALIIILYSGIKYITSGGDPVKVASARKTLTFAIIGLVLIVLAFVFLNFLAAATGNPCIKTLGFGCG